MTVPRQADARSGAEHSFDDGSASLLASLRGYLPEERIEAIRDAYEFAAEAHGEQRRLSGEPYIVHPIAVAQLVADLRMDVHTVQAALLHDVMEDCGVTREQLGGRFGGDVASLVEGATKIEQIPAAAGPGGKSAADAETVRKMLLAMAEDVRVVIVKIADRLHNMRTIEYLEAHRQAEIARETMEIYARSPSASGSGR